MENDKKCERHFHFSDKVTYIEHQEITVQSGANFYNGPAVEPQNAIQQEIDIEAALEALYEEFVETDGRTEPLFSDQTQWYAVYRVLSEYCNYPAKISDFVKLIKEKKLDIKKPLCVYSSIRKANTDLSALAVKVGQWWLHKDKGEKYMKQYLVAQFLLKNLGYEE